MAVKVFSLCLLAVALLGCLSRAQNYFQSQNQQNSQSPQYSQKGQNFLSSQKGSEKPDPPQQDICQVAAESRIQCGLPGISESDCRSISCCFDGQICHYSNAVTLQCTKDGQFIVVIARDVTYPSIDLGSIHFMGAEPNCQPVDSNSAFAIYQFTVDSCGTTMKESEENVLIYESRIASSYEVAVGHSGAITRDTQFELLLQCRYIGTSVLALVTQIGAQASPLPVAAPGPLRVELRLANGKCAAKGCMEADVAYNSYYMDYDYPVRMGLRQSVYVDVRMLERTDPNLVLTLGRCWATSKAEPLSFPQWDLLVDGCPNADDRYLSTLVPVVGSSDVPFPSHHRRFIFKMFTFVATGSDDPTTKDTQDAILTPLQEMVYIHCTTAACQRTPQDNCEPRCSRRRRNVVTSEKSDSTNIVSSDAIIFVKPDNTKQ